MRTTSLGILPGLVSLLAVASTAGGSPDLDAIVDSGEVFVERQLAKFPLPGDYPAGFETARLIQTYDLPPPEFTGSDHPLSHRADVYDSSLALIDFVGCRP